MLKSFREEIGMTTIRLTASKSYTLDLEPESALCRRICTRAIRGVCVVAVTLDVTAAPRSGQLGYLRNDCRKEAESALLASAVTLLVAIVVHTLEDRNRVDG